MEFRLGPDPRVGRLDPLDSVPVELFATTTVAEFARIQAVILRFARIQAVANCPNSGEFGYASSCATSMRFHLVTYNIHKGIGGVDRRYRPERIVEALQHHRPDLVLLQEVDDGVPR